MVYVPLPDKTGGTSLQPHASFKFDSISTILLDLNVEQQPYTDVMIESRLRRLFKLRPVVSRSLIHGPVTLVGDLQCGVTVYHALDLPKLLYLPDFPLSPNIPKC